jgi:mannose-6-phosphate isomerase-like protein (cupin superfamily)
MNPPPKQYKSYIEKRPWGSFEKFADNEVVTVKFLNVDAGQTLSLQLHHKRQEYWRVVSGTPLITIGEDTVMAQPGEEFFIDVETTHRLAGGETGTVILEIMRGEYDENDIVRFEDAYGRT